MFFDGDEKILCRGGKGGRGNAKFCTPTRQAPAFSELGEKTTEYELKCLIRDIISRKIPLYCPHGRPVIISLTQKEIEKQFGRA